MTNFQIVARNLIVDHLARVIVESTIKMVVKLAKYRIQARSVLVKVVSYCFRRVGCLDEGRLS